MRYCSLLLLLMLAIVLASCSSDALVGPDRSSEIMPLSVGDYWIGRTTQYDDFDNLVSTTFDTMRVWKDTSIGGEQWFFTDSSVIQTNRSDGHWIGIASIDPYLVLRFPAAVGDTCATFVVNGTQGDTLVTYIKITSTNATVTVPAGTFICHEYTIYSHLNSEPDQPTGQMYYYAPGVGPVKRLSNSLIRGREIWELMRYHIL